jgi:cation transporter-like permease
MGSITAAIDWDAIAQLLWVAPIAGLAVAITYSLMIVGFARSSEARRDGSGGATAMAYSVLALLSTAAFLAVVVYGVVIIVKK